MILKSVKKKMTRVLMSALVCVLFIVLQFSSCDEMRGRNSIKSQNMRSVAEDESNLKKHRQLWREKRIENYDFVASIITGGLSYHARPVLIKVRDSRNISTEAVLKTDPRNLEIYKPFDTIDKMFDTIGEKLQNDRVRITVEYNDEFGYPQRILIDEGPIDAHTSMEVSKFEIIN